MRYRFPYVGADLRYLVLSQTPAYTARPRIRASVTRCACLLPQLSPVTQLRLPTNRGMAQAAASVVYPSKDGHQSMALGLA